MTNAAVEATADDLTDPATAKRAEKDRLAAEQAEAGGEALRELAAPALVLHDADAPLIPGTDLAIIPPHREMQGLAAMAVTLAGANALPTALRNRPNDVFMVLLTARDLGVATTTALREFHVIDGRVTISPKAKLAMVNERGRREGWAVWPDPGNNAETATWHATRADRPGIEFSYTFTKLDAVGAGLSGKDNWKHYPQRMLSWRALGYLLDDVFPEIGTGLYSPDELGAVTDEDGMPVIDVRSTEPLRGMRSPTGQNAPGNNDDPGELTAEQFAERWALQERVYSLPEDAKATFRDRWKGMQRLRPHRLSELPADCLNLVASVLRGLEQQTKTATKGEWDPDVALAATREQEARLIAGLFCPSAVPPQDAPEAAGDTNPASDTTATGDEPTATDAAEIEQPSLIDAPLDDETVAREAGEEQTKVTIALVKTMSIDKVDALLLDHKQSVDGNEDTRRARLTMTLLRETISKRDQQ